MSRDQRKADNQARIATAAMDLFAERGFERVSVAEVAATAGVTEKTVFNHFPSKEDLVYPGDEEFERALLDAVRTRPSDASFVDAASSFLLDVYGRGSAARGAMRRARSLAALVSDSPALLKREREIFSRYADALRDELADERGSNRDDLLPSAVASALIGVHQAVIAGFRQGLLANEPASALQQRMIASAAEIFDFLTTVFAGLARDGCATDRLHHGTRP